MTPMQRYRHDLQRADFVADAATRAAAMLRDRLDVALLIDRHAGDARPHLRRVEINQFNLTWGALAASASGTGGAGDLLGERAGGAGGAAATGAGAGGASGATGAMTTGAAGGGASCWTVIVGAGVGGGVTTTSGGGTNDGGGGSVFGGGGRFSGGGGGGLTSSMILVSMGALMISTTLRARPLTRAQPSSRCMSKTTPMPTMCLVGLRCCCA